MTHFAASDSSNANTCLDAAVNCYEVVPSVYRACDNTRTERLCCAFVFLCKGETDRQTERGSERQTEAEREREEGEGEGFDRTWP